MNHKRKRSDKIYEVQKIIGKRTNSKLLQYKVKWKGYSIREATWEPIKNLGNVQNLIQKYERNTELKSRKKRERLQKKKNPLFTCFRNEKIGNDDNNNNDATISNCNEEQKSSSLFIQENEPNFESQPKIVIMLNEYKKDQNTTTDEKDFQFSNNQIINKRITELEPFGHDIIALVLEENEQKQKIQEKAMNISELRKTNPQIIIDYFVADYLERHKLSVKY